VKCEENPPGLSDLLVQFFCFFLIELLELLFPLVFSAPETPAEEGPIR